MNTATEGASMTDRQVRQLAELLADYAEAYGIDCDADITVKQLADDLADGTAPLEDARDRIYDGLNEARPRSAA